MNNFKLKLTVMILFSVLFMILIIGPDVSNSIEASNSATDSVTAGEAVDLVSTGEAIDIDEQSNVSDVTCEIDYPDVGFQLKYNKYPITFTYILIENPEVYIRKSPSEAEPIIRTAAKNEKISYMETITNDQKWYHITWREKDQRWFGFVKSDAVSKRIFQFDKMHSLILAAEDEYAQGKLTYINNYQNRKGTAPAYKGKDLDQEGNRRSQSAPGYPDLSNKAEFTYIGDGTLVRVLSSDNNFTKVSLVKDHRIFYIPNKYVQTQSPLQSIKKVIAIDRKNQNEVVFEKIEDEWKVISYTLATTGKVGKYHQPTPLGYYYAIEKRDHFYYYKDGTTTIQGYAPYTIRFAGGAYVHGVPVDYKYDQEGKRIDPGKIEYSRSMGTVPLSHKCVRNYTSHAKFLYDWYSPGETIVIVLE